jgi:curli biogenesis system outer membrane secretion channel CsgG
MTLAEVPKELPGDSYRIKASELNAEAGQEADAERRKELKRLAMAYLRLADQAERNARNNVVYETPPPRSAVQPQQQQQQQQQQAGSKDDGERQP